MTTPTEPTQFVVDAEKLETMAEMILIFQAMGLRFTKENPMFDDIKHLLKGDSE